MNSCLYECSVMHRRFTPKEHFFQHSIFMFYLDLDELAVLSKKILPFSHNRPNLYSFCDADHEPAGGKSLKDALLAFLVQNGVAASPSSRVMLLTLSRIFGHVFNPIAIYFCFREDGQPLAAVAEVGNTFHEKKLYLLGADELFADGVFKKMIAKDFYVSPFSALDLHFDFRLKIPGETLDVKIDDRAGEEKIFISTLSGRQVALNNRTLLWFTFKYPLVTLKVIFLIHWHALRLWLKRAPFHRKSANTEGQQGVLRPHATLVSRTK